MVPFKAGGRRNRRAAVLDAEHTLPALRTSAGACAGPQAAKERNEQMSQSANEPISQ
jgi:hypothetical protein